MATYTQLQADVNAFAVRTVPAVCYQLLTEELNARLRLSLMEATTTITINAESEALPAGFLQARAFYLSDEPRTPLEIVSEFSRARQFRTSGRPRQVAFNDGVALFNPAPDGEYSGELRYIAKLANLSAGSDTNDVMDNHYPIYLYGALKHFSNFLGGDDGNRGMKWEAAFERALADAQRSDGLKRYGGGPLVSQPVAVG